MANHPLTRTRAPRRFLIWLAALIVATLAGATLAPPATAAGTMPAWQLPFENGQSWQAGAPHSTNGGSLDFGPIGGSNSHVVSVAAGTVYQINCPGGSYLGIDHGNGWRSTYYHLTNYQFGLVGSTVPAGTYLGEAGQPLPCGGDSNFNHVHLTILRDGTPTNVSGLAFGNYRVFSSGQAYWGYWETLAGSRVITNSGNAACCLLSTTTATSDRDGDGVTDASDRCPDVAGPGWNGGCPDRLAAVYRGGGLIAKDGLFGGWVNEIGGVRQTYLAGNRIGALLTDGTLLAKDGLHGAWVTENGSIAAAAFLGDRIAAIYTN